MSVENWYRDAGATDFWGFEGEGPGTAVGSPTFVDGLGGGLAAATDGDDGFVVQPRLSRTSQSFSVAFWFLPTSGSPSGDVFRWGSTPGVGVEWNGAGGSRRPETVTFWVRVSNGSFALRLDSPTTLAPDRWHLLVLTVETINIWGGVQAVAYVDGERVGAGSYRGGLFNWVNMNRPSTLTVLAGGAAGAVDEMGLLATALSGSEVSALMGAGPSDTSVARYGWGVVF